MSVTSTNQFLVFFLFLISLVAKAATTGSLTATPSSISTAESTIAAPEANTSSVAITPGAASSNTSKVVKDDPDYFSKSSFGVLFYGLGGYDDSQFKAADPSFSMYDSYLSFSWKMPNDLRFSLLPTFGYTTSGKDYRGRDATDKFYWRDFSIAVAQNRLFEDVLPATWSLKQKARLYLPTSDGSKEEGMIARLRLELEGRYNLDRYSYVRMYGKPSYYFQRSTSYLTADGKSFRSTNLAQSEHGTELNWSLHKLFSIKPGFEIKEEWKNKSEVNNLTGLHRSEIGYRLGFEIRPTRDMNFTLGIQETHDLISPDLTPVVGYSLLTNIVIF